MAEKSKPRGYLIVHHDWYERPDEDDFLKKHAVVSTLDPDAFAPAGDTQLLKHSYRVLEVAEELPHEFTIGECRVIGEPHYETLAEAKEFVRRQGVAKPEIGFNPVGE